MAGLDLAKITAETVRLLDSEGLSKFSMRRLAAGLGVTAMSVYWYVDTKDDLLELALDAVMGELSTPAPAPDAPKAGTGTDWRTELRRLASGYRSVLVRHPWVSPLIGEFLNIGPHAVKFTSAAQDVMREAGLPLHGRTGGLAAVFQFVYGFGTVEGHFRDRCERAGMSQDAYYQRAIGTISEQPGLREPFVQAQHMRQARGGDTVEEMRERDFDFAVDLLIAGIEAKRTADRTDG